jgi:hypothetical protein
MGTYFEEGAEIELHEKQAKYPLMSGQIVAMDPPAPKARKRQPQETVRPPYFEPRGTVAGTPKKTLDKEGEFSTGKKVGGSFGGNIKKP